MSKNDQIIKLEDLLKKAEKRLKSFFRNKRTYRYVFYGVIVIVLVGAGLAWYMFNKEEVAPAKAGWWNDSWNYRKAIVINNEYVTADLTDFPLLVSLIDENLGDHAQDDGDDIVFVANNGEKLAHEIESFATTTSGSIATGTLVAWVKIPSLSSTEDTTIYLYYGNAGVADQSDAANVWDDNYVMVQHMASTSPTTRYDSTKNNNDGTTSGYEGDEATTTAKINGADDFDGSDDHIDVTDNPSLGGMGGLTISAWVRFDQMPTTAGQNALIVEKRHVGEPYVSYIFDVRQNGGLVDELYFAVRNDSGDAQNTEGDTSLATSTWHYIVGTWDGTDLHVYLDGQLDDGMSNTQSGTVYDSNSDLVINYSSQIDGQIDEVRISKVGRSPAWIKTSYNNQNATSTFYAIQSEEVGPGPVGYWAFDKGYGTIAEDSSANNNDGTITGAVWQDESMCVSGKCLYFDGSDDYVEVADFDL